jgi:hypothetical protein
MTGSNTAALLPWLRRCGMTDADLGRVFSTFNAAAPAFADVHGGRHPR